MARWKKVSSWLAGVLALVLVAVVVASVWTARRSFPQTDGTLVVEGLSAPVTVRRDGYGIPQVYADTSTDLFFAQGYVQAQDRFFEMDFRRHLTAGRLSELFGRGALETDMFVRTLGWRRVAESELALLSPDTKKYLESFAQGVNAYLDDHDGAELSLEYAVLGLGGLDYSPEPWTAADSVAWLKAMAWNLGSNLADEVERTLDSSTLSRAQVAQLFPEYPYAENQPIVTQGALVDRVYEQDAEVGGTRLPARPGFLVRPAARALAEVKDTGEGLSSLLARVDGVGSNAWAVSGEHTASGAPLLANDPHLGASIPGTWYQMGLHCTEITRDCPFDVTGFTFAGLPGVVIGHNADIAWGFTNLYPDVQDLYLEKVTDDDRYVYDGRRLDLVTREESFTVDGEDDPVVITVRESSHGPLISDVNDDYARVGEQASVRGAGDDSRPEYAVALRWTALEPGRTADAIFGFDAATSWDEFREAARSMVAPSQNLVYADVRGHIGYQAPGRVPIRRTGHGDWPVPGWDPAYEWDDDYVPYDALPTVLDPDDGFVVTANQAVTDKRYPYYLGDSFDYGFRAQRIRELLEADDALTVDDMAAIQLDDYSLLAERLAPRLEEVELPSSYYAAGQRELVGWDFRQDADSSAAAYFNVVLRQLLELIFADQLVEDTMPAGGSRWWVVLDNLLDDPRDPFWDDITTPDDRETRDDILATALMEARDELTRERSRNPDDWTWGSLHTLTLRNETLAAEDSPVDQLFARGGYELGGGPSIVNAASWDATEGYEVTAVPSMRMIVPLEALDQSRWINLTGASGHAFNDHYTDQTELWADGRMLSWPFSPEAVDAATEQTLVLEPRD